MTSDQREQLEECSFVPYNLVKVTPDSGGVQHHCADSFLGVDDEDGSNLQAGSRKKDPGEVRAQRTVYISSSALTLELSDSSSISYSFDTSLVGSAI